MAGRQRTVGGVLRHFVGSLRDVWIRRPFASNLGYLNDDQDESAMTSSVAASRVRSVESAAIAGLAYAVLSSASRILLNSPPAMTAPESEIVAWYSDAGNRASLTLGLSLSVFAVVSFVWFVAVIRRRVGEREDKFFATVFLGSGILIAALALVGNGVLASTAVTVDLLDGRVPDVDVLSAVTGLGRTLLVLVLVRVQAVFIMSASTLALRTNAFSRWLSYFGYAVALWMFFVPFLIEPLRLGFPIWVAILSVALLVRRDDLMPDGQE